MKKLALLTKQLSRKIDTHRLTVAPFPGAYPTRWSAIVTQRHKVFAKNRRSWHWEYDIVYTYKGKPNQAVAEHLLKLMETLDGGLTFHEYDKIGVFLKIDEGWPRRPGDGHDWSYSKNVCIYYYPFNEHSTLLEQWAKRGMRSLLMQQSKTKKHVVYMNWEGDPANHMAALRNHKAWLDTNTVSRSSISGK